MNNASIKLYVDGVYNEILLDDIIYIKVTGKWCHFILQGSDPEIKITLKTVWEMTKKYSKEIQKTSKENESIQRELQTFKKKHNLK